jgi:hypothetical protein
LPLLQKSIRAGAPPHGGGMKRRPANSEIEFNAEPPPRTGYTLAM